MEMVKGGGKGGLCTSSHTWMSIKDAIHIHVTVVHYIYVIHVMEMQ